MSDFIVGQRYLSYSEALHNVKLIVGTFVKDGWTKEAFCGLQGNGWRESHNNPSLMEFSGGGGGGWYQWTPFSKMRDWAIQQGQDPLDGHVQQERLIYEKNNAIQWFPNPIADIPYISFKEFTQLKDVEHATKAFMYFYEHPGDLALAERIEYANKFFKDIDYNGSGGNQKCYTKPIKDTNIDKSSFLSGQLFGNTRPGWENGDFHDGLDFGSIDHPGNEMLAVTNGTITHVGFMNGLRAYFVLNDGEYNIVYQEFSYNVGNIKVKVGDKVKTNDVLAIRDADHLHLGFTKKEFMQALGDSYTNNGTWEDPLNFLGKCFGGGNPDPKPEPEPDDNKNNFIYIGRY